MSLSNVKSFEAVKRSSGRGSSNPDFVEMESMEVGNTLVFSLEDRTKYWYNHARWRMIQWAKKNGRKYEISKGKARLDDGHVVTAMRIHRVV